MGARVTTAFAALLMIVLSGCTASDGNQTSGPGERGTPPTAAPGKELTAPLGSLVVLDGSGSNDRENKPLQYGWGFRSVPQGSEAVLSDPTAAQPSFLADLPGTYVARLIVSNGSLWSEPSVFTITVASVPQDPGNLPPVARIRPVCHTVHGGSVTLDGTSSSDPEGASLAYTWIIQRRPPNSHAILLDPTSPTASLTPDEDGDYLIQLIVRDDIQPSVRASIVVQNSSAPLRDKTDEVTFRFNSRRTGSITGGGLKPPFRRRWRISVMDDDGIQPRYVSRPIVTPEAVYFMSTTKNNDCRLHGHRIDTGKELWPPIKGMSSCDFNDITYAKGKLFTMGLEGLVRAFDATSGLQLWSTQLPYKGGLSYVPLRTFSPLALYGGRIYASSLRGGITILNQSDGKMNFEISQSWMDENGKAIFASAAIPSVSSQGIFAMWDHPFDLLTHDPVTGSQKWLYKNEACPDQPDWLGSTVQGTGFVYANYWESCGPANDVLLDYNGRVILKMTPRVSSSSYVAADAGRLIMDDRNKDGTYILSSLDVLNKSLEWNVPTSAKLTLPPTIVNDSIIYGDTEGRLVVSDKCSGEVQWTDNVTHGVSLGYTSFLPVDPDFGSNGDVFVVPAYPSELFVYETDATPDINDSYATHCEGPGNRLYLSGDESVNGVNDMSLLNGDPVIQGEKEVNSSTGVVNVRYEPPSGSQKFDSISVSTDHSDFASMGNLVFRGKAGELLKEQQYEKAQLNQFGVNDSAAVAMGKCRSDSGKFQITTIERDASGLKRFSANFIHHCDMAGAAVRGCVKWERPTP